RSCLSINSLMPLSLLCLPARTGGEPTTIRRIGAPPYQRLVEVLVFASLPERCAGRLQPVGTGRRSEGNPTTARAGGSPEAPLRDASSRRRAPSSRWLPWEFKRGTHGEYDYAQVT